MHKIEGYVNISTTLRFLVEKQGRMCLVGFVPLPTLCLRQCELLTEDIPDEQGDCAEIVRGMQYPIRRPTNPIRSEDLTAI